MLAMQPDVAGGGMGAGEGAGAGLGEGTGEGPVAADGDVPLVPPHDTTRTANISGASRMRNGRVMPQLSCTPAASRVRQPVATSSLRTSPRKCNDRKALQACPIFRA